jgi:hypothetical protein
MKNDFTRPGTLMRATLIMPHQIGESQLPEVIRHLDDTLTTLDGLYTQLALVAIGDIREACTYEQAARRYLKDFYYCAIQAVSHQQIGEDCSMPTYDQYPFTSLTNPLLRFNRESLEKYSVSLQPLTLSAIKTGSLNIDLLGVGKILEFIEHAVKQIRWEARHERELARRSMHLVSLEEQLIGQRVVEAHLTNEEKRLNIASRKIELLEDIRDLDLPMKQKRELVKSVVGKVELVRTFAEVKVIRKQLPVPPTIKPSKMDRRTKEKMRSLPPSSS